ncbi:MAG: trypsin-like peptidase domain-containing protein [Pirellulales bacterium]|nr:trypsin-like peptidase domain-containing protein [Pirellulales bacterium]
MRHLFIGSVAAMLLSCPGASGWAVAQELSNLDAAAALEKTLVEAIARAEKSVVAVARVKKTPEGESLLLESRPDPFGRRALLPAAPQPSDPDFLPNDYGAGVVVDRQGLILTAYHVLGEDSEYYVTTADRKIYKATPKAADPRSDLAVLSIEAHDLTPITFGDAAKIKKGQIVVVLGNPYAIARDGQASASWGIVSNLARKAPAVPSESDITGKPTLHHFGTLIQTDAKLNFGASGGALLNLRGEMVGLTVSWAATAGFESAAGYAIPIDATFLRVLETLKLGREVEYGFLGVPPANLQSREMLQGLHGVRVSQTVPGTPAVKAGVRAGDIITAVNDEPIHDADGFVLAVGKQPAEATVKLAVLRGGRPRAIEAKLSKYPVRGKKIATQAEPLWRGLRVEYPTAVVDEQGRGMSGIAFPSEGVTVVEVAENSPAAAAGLRVGAIVTHVGRTPVNSPKEFRAAVENSSGPVTVQIADDRANPARIIEPGN